MIRKANKKRGSAEVQLAKRLDIVNYLRKGLGNQIEASEVFQMSLSGVQKIWTRYKESGVKGLENKKRGVRDGKKINKVQTNEVKRLIKDKLPDQLKLPFGLWTREAVAMLIKNKYGIKLSRWQVGRYLKAWGYTPQKPIRKAFEQKPEVVKKWLEEEFPKIQKRAKRENAIIYFGDETGMRSDHQAGRSYAPKGKTPIIKQTGKRFSLNMISAISNRGHLQFMILENSFNSGVFLLFLKQMIKQSKQKIFLVVDGHPAHKTLKIKEWLEENTEKIEVFYLPPYSPELNPQEYLNQDLKTNVIGKLRPINKIEMKRQVNNFLYHRKARKYMIGKYFHGNHVKYAA